MKATCTYCGGGGCSECSVSEHVRYCTDPECKVCEVNCVRCDTTPKHVSRLRIYFTIDELREALQLLPTERVIYAQVTEQGLMIETERDDDASR